jgi:hypothetical protein
MLYTKVRSKGIESAGWWHPMTEKGSLDSDGIVRWWLGLDETCFGNDGAGNFTGTKTNE